LLKYIKFFSLNGQNRFITEEPQVFKANERYYEPLRYEVENSGEIFPEKLEKKKSDKSNALFSFPQLEKRISFSKGNSPISFNFESHSGKLGKLGLMKRQLEGLLETKERILRKQKEERLF
jgi:hypothetical protein